MTKQGRRAVQLGELQRPRQASTTAGGWSTFGNKLLQLLLKAMANL